jgi:hypothetical protein
VKLEASHEGNPFSLQYLQFSRHAKPKRLLSSSAIGSFGYWLLSGAEVTVVTSTYVPLYSALQLLS